ncbi:SDR family NAD(P)-dependent oxidoreductase [Archangium gephyra]|uniref:SDR family NAD(P)-dependent oxidoreductase n=1 Tax=Archangium gephyra TaxID=48 RepID=UPI003B7BB437
MQLKDKRIIVTGGARGIGASTVRVFVAEGARVVSLDVLDELGQRVVNEAHAQGPGTARYFHCDISQRASVDAAFSAATAHLGGLDVLANVAGIDHHAPAEDITDADWDRVFAVNVKGTLLTNQAAFRAMRESGGHIINFGSDAGLIPYPTAGHYSAAKGAVMAWTRTAAAEWGRYRITVNSVVPAMWTPMYEETRALMTPEQLAQHDAAMKHIIPLGGRLGDTDKHFAPVMVFLAGNGSDFITGQILSVNGGLCNVR